MMFILANLIATLGVASAARLSSDSRNIAFERAMDIGIRNGKAKKNLNEKLLAAAVRVPSDRPEFMDVNTGSRRLADDDSMADDQFGGFAFDVSEYSLKYIKCAAINTFNDDLANDMDSESVLIAQRFAIFRLCPSNTCNDNDRNGCKYNYGEYILDLGIYLEAMQEYREERAQAYCAFCEDCMALENQERRRLADDDSSSTGTSSSTGSTATSSTTGTGTATSSVTATATTSTATFGHACAYYNECYNYENVCANDDDAVIEYENFFECQNFEGRNGDIMYVGPHCGSDGRTIQIGLYYDQYCTHYAGNDIDLNYFTSMGFQKSGLAQYYKQDCISCKESELPYEQVNDDVTDADAISAICENLYYDAGKCNKNMGEEYYSQNEENSENLVCTYIQNIMKGRYDEYGEIHINNFDVGVMIDTVRELTTPGQAAALGLMVIFCVSLVVYSAILYHQVSALGPIPDENTDNDGWKPRKGLFYGDISRQNSGIVIGRSRSGGSYAGGIMA